MFDKLGLKNRVVDSFDGISVSDRKINYDQVQLKLNAFRKESQDFLRGSLEKISYEMECQKGESNDS